MDASTYTQNKKAAVTATGDAAISGDKTRAPAPSSNTVTVTTAAGPVKVSLDVFLARFKKETIVAGQLNDNVARNGNGLNARFKSIAGLFQLGETVYIVDRAFFTIRKYNSITRDVTTYIATSADADLNPTITTNLFNYPNCLAHDPVNNIMYIGQTREILKVDMNTNTISKLNNTFYSYAGGDVNVASMVYKSGFLYGMDSQEGFIFRVNVTTGSLEVIAGARELGFVNGIAGASRFNTGFLLTSCVAVDDNMNMYIGDRLNLCIRKLNLITLEVTTFVQYTEPVDIVKFNRYDNSLYYAVGNNSIFKLSLDNTDESGKIASSDDGITTLAIADRKTLFSGSSRGAIYMYNAI